KIGVSHARALFLTGERFSAERAENIGLVHEVVRFEDLDTAVDRVVDEIKSGGRNAIAVAKKTIAEVTARREDAREITSQAIAQQRTSPEGQEGLRAFLERRKPNWTE
ncbi:MAG: enoyl-CoA hydratase/isomerase family protein, partial [Candidatus Eremiobacteraeota bacterium]|nr:enoyl-CoA hydratase/isomerase family protein [Candidatus Eremiobacteraeota bacterium]